MRYLKSFTFPTERNEMLYFFEGNGAKRAGMSSYPDSIYPFKIFSEKPLITLELSQITFLYGGNGSGKSTALNVIAEKLKMHRTSPFNVTPFYMDFLGMCEYSLDEKCHDIPGESRIVTSDDVFDFLLTIRSVNRGVDAHRQNLYREYYEAVKGSFRMATMDDYEELKRRHEINSSTVNSYMKKRLPGSFVSCSNGESAYGFFTREIRENALYLLDEPENSMSAEFQIEFAKFLSDSSRFYGCQFIISTHSPFLLAIPGARIYDLDSRPVICRKWTELENVRMYRDFFESHREEF